MNREQAAEVRRQIDELERIRYDPVWFAEEVLRLSGDRYYLDKWQKELLEAVADVYRKKRGVKTAINKDGKSMITIRAMHGPGKEQPVTEPVMTPSGWVEIGKLKPCDLIYAGDGSVTKVNSVHPQGVKPVYKIHLSDGSFTYAGMEHLWQVHERVDSGRVTKIVSTQEMLLAGLKVKTVPRYRLPTCGVIHAADAELEVEPYLLGAWLGDGCVGTGKICKPDESIWEEIRKVSDKVSDVKNNSTSFSRNIVGLLGGLRLLGLSELKSFERFIPEAYLRASPGQRLSLLQGLMDTDGYVEDDGVSACYSTSSSFLADGIQELVRSLGGQTRRNLKPEPKYAHNGEVRTGKPAHILKITLPAIYNPFRCATKKGRYVVRADSEKNKVRCLHRYVTAIEYDREEESVCISIDHPSHLYITRNHIVTHNTFIVAALMHWFNAAFRGRIICTAPKEKQLITRLWPAFRKIMVRAGQEYSATLKVDSVKITWHDDEDWCALAETAGQPENLAGYHDDYMLFIVDEASGVNEAMFPVIEGAISTGTLVILILIGNPTRNQGTFFDSHCRPVVAKNYHQVHVDLSKTTRVSKEWVERMVDKYGRDSPVVKVRCYGEFADTDSSQLIPLQWLADAAEREAIPDGSLPRLRVTVDVADGGEDFTVITVAMMYDTVTHFLKQEKFNFPSSESPILAAQAAIKMFKDFNGRKDQDDIVVDSLGVGAGTAGYVMQQGYLTVTYKGGESSDDSDKWRNRRTQSYICLRDEHREKRVCYADNFTDEWDDFTAQMCSVKTKPGSERVEELMTKEEMKRKGIKSPDMADGCAMMFATQQPTEPVLLAVSTYGDMLSAKGDW